MGSIDAAILTLDRKIGQLRLMVDAPEEIVAAVAKTVERTINAQLSAGRAPDGSPWPTRQDGSGKVLQGARDHVRVGSIGKTIIVRLVGREHVLHHFGYARGGVKPQIIPEGNGLPPMLRDAIEKAIAREYRERGYA